MGSNDIIVSGFVLILDSSSDEVCCYVYNFGM